MRDGISPRPAPGSQPAATRRGSEFNANRKSSVAGTADEASMSTAPGSPATAGIMHHTAAVNGTELHYVSAGTTGSPILLVHRFPESWWAFHRLIPLLAERHRVFAVDLRGFGDSRVSEDDYDSAAAAEDLHQLIACLGAGPVHLTGQDISGGTVFRLAATRPGDIASFTAIEIGLAGFG